MTWKKYLAKCRKQNAGKASTAADTKKRKKKSASRNTGTGEGLMAVCGEEWRVMKEKNRVPAGMTWGKFLGECADRNKGKIKPTPAQQAMYTRIKSCGRQWQKAKEKGRTKGQKWPQYWSACNKRLKARGQ